MPFFVGAHNTTTTLSSSSVGKILQVQQTIKTDTASYYLSSSGTSMSYTSEIMTVSITPSNSNNKILVTGFLTVCGEYTDRINIRLLKNSGEIGAASGDASGSHRRRGHANADIDNTRSMSTPICYLDTAGSTSAITYGYNAAQGSGGTGWLYINRQGSGFSDEANRFLATSVITATEIAV